MAQVKTSNRIGLHYRQEAERFPKLPYPIIDTHTHIHGKEATRLFAEAARWYGVGLTYSMTAIDDVDEVRDIMGDAVRFIAFPTMMAKDPLYEHTEGFLRNLERFYQKGARICKFWSAPRGIDMGTKAGSPDLLRINAPHRIEQMKAARDLGMIFMAHIGDPDTWFATKYSNADVYHTKRWHYEQFEEVLDMFDTPWIGAHMGGWPEDLGFLSDLMTRHPNLYLDASATKWMVRELSRIGRDDLLAFLQRWSGRIMFGSDIIAMDTHLSSDAGDTEMARKASSREEAYDLYASRYWALRTLFETTYDGESPISDPDLNMVDPNRYADTDAPRLLGKALPPDVLKMLYHDAAHQLLEPLYSR